MAKLKCLYCTRECEVTKKGGLKPHLTPGGLQCMGTAMQIAPRTLTSKPALTKRPRR